MPKRALTVTALALAGLALWLLLGPTEDTEAESRQEGSTPEAGALHVEDVVEVGASSGRVQRTPDESTRPAVAGGVDVRVTVVDGRTGDALPDVDVHVAKSALMQQIEFRNASQRRERRELATVQMGEVHRTDAFGAALFKMDAEDSFLAVVSTPTRWGSVEGSAESAVGESGAIEVRMEVEFDLSLQVRVVDSLGQPAAGVPVAYAETDRWPRWREALTVETDAEGRAELRHLGPAVLLHHGPDSRHFVTAVLPFAAPPLVEFDPYAPPLEEVLLQLPATGRLEVELLDFEGRPAEIHQAVEVQRRMPEEQRASYSTASSGMIRQTWLGLHRAYPKGNVAVFERIGVGLELAVGVEFVHRGRTESLFTQGPSSPGETRHVVLRQSRPEDFLTGRLLHADGSPHADGDADAWLIWIDSDSSRGARERLRVPTGKDGGFHIPLGDAPIQQIRDARVLFIDRQTPGHRRAWLSRTLPALDPGVIDLGDLQVELAPLVSGRVLDSDGLPVANAGVVVRSRDEGGPLGLQSTTLDEALITLLGARTDAEGRFRIDGPDFPGIALRVECERGDPRPGADFEAGDEDVLLQAANLEVGVRGRLLLPPEVQTTWLECWARVDGGAHSFRLQADGGFFARLRPETEYRLQVLGAGTQNLLRELPGLRVSAGELRDLGEIDLRGLRVFMVHVVDRDGQRIEQARISLGARQRIFPGHAATTPIRVLEMDAAPQITVSADGYRPQDAVLTGPSTTVELEQGISVELHFAEHALLPEVATLQISSVREDASGEAPLSGPNTGLDHEGRAQIRLPAPGNWTFRYTLLVRSDASTMAVGGNFGITRAQVADDSQVPTIPLEVDTDKILERLAELEDS